MAQLDKLLEKDDALMVQVILRLVEQKPGFKDANFLVMQKVLHTITRLAKSQFFTKSMAELVLAGTPDRSISLFFFVLFSFFLCSCPAC